MIIEEIVLKKLIASEGKVLTDGNTYAKVHHLADSDSALNWHEITEAEYERIEERKKENELLPDNR